MNDRDARERRYKRLIEGFIMGSDEFPPVSPEEAHEIMKPPKRTHRLRKPLPLEKVSRPRRGVIIRIL
jgi:hypothetical protein